MFAVPVAGVPLSVAVPLWLSTKVTPPGSVPVSVRVGVGVPVVVTENVLGVPAVNVALLALVIAGPALGLFTVSVKAWVAGVPTPFVAVKVMGKVPLLPVAGVPLRVAAPFPLSLKVTPLGSVPVSVRVGVGVPVVVIENVPAVPTVNVVLLALVITGAALALFTVSVKALVAAEPTPLLAVNVMEYALLVPAAGVPDKVPVPFPLSLKVTPPGSAPVWVKAGVGAPVAVTENVPAVPTVNVVLLALVIAGPVFEVFTVRVKAWVAGVPIPFVAVSVTEYAPPVPDAGVPLNVPTPFPLSAKLTPDGSTPASVKAGVGKPVVITANDPGVPTTNAVLLGLVKAGP